MMSGVKQSISGQACDLSNYFKVCDCFIIKHCNKYSLVGTAAWTDIQRLSHNLWDLNCPTQGSLQPTGYQLCPHKIPLMSLLHTCKGRLQGTPTHKEVKYYSHVQSIKCYLKTMILNPEQIKILTQPKVSESFLFTKSLLMQRSQVFGERHPS